MALQRLSHPDSETERFLARAAALGDRAALREFVAYGMVLVHAHAARLGFTGPDRDEAIAAGTEGLMRAVERFDPGRSVRFATFAWDWIARSMQPERPLAAFELPSDEPGPSLDLDTLLPDDEWRAVIECRYGFHPEQPTRMSLAATAQRLGLTTWQVRDREAKAIAYLRERLDRVSSRAPE